MPPPRASAALVASLALASACVVGAALASDAARFDAVGASSSADPDDYAHPPASLLSLASLSAPSPRRALLVTCPTGSAHDAALGACATTCGGGEYRDDATSRSIGGVAVVGACAPCAAGTYRDAGDSSTPLTACAPCPVGASNPRLGQSACIPCSNQGDDKYANASGSATCASCPANTHQLTGDDVEAVGVRVDACACRPGFYDPVANRTGVACVPCPKGATCAGDLARPASLPVYFGCAPPNDLFFMRCHRMINNESPCLGGNLCQEGFEGMSCSRCKRGYYRFQRQCVECGAGGAGWLVFAYFWLLIAFYLVKKLSTIVLPSMYIILTYIQCLSIVGNRQGWGTERSKAFLKTTEIVNFSLDLFIPSCAKEIPYVHKALAFTLSPIFFVLVDVLLVDPFFARAWPWMRRTVAEAVVRRRRRASGSFPETSSEARDGTRPGGLGVEEGVKEEDEEKGAASGTAAAARWFRAHDWAAKVVAEEAAARRARARTAADPDLTFWQKCKKHFFEDMRLMYVATTGALLKSLRCTPVGDRDVSNFWLSRAWFGSSVLSADPEQRCWTGTHATLAPYFFVTLALYGVGYPLATLKVLRDAKNPKVRQGWHPKVYGRLYRRFESEYYWWEVVYLMRRLCLVSFRTLMNDRRAEVYLARAMQGWQGLCFVLTLLVALLAQFYAHPFKLEHMDLLDATLLCCLFLIVWLSMAFDVALKNTSQVDALEALVFLVAAVSVAVSVYALLLDVYHTYAKRNQKPPKWIARLIFAVTPPGMLVALGLASKSTAKQIEELVSVMNTHREAKKEARRQASRKSVRLLAGARTSGDGLADDRFVSARGGFDVDIEEEEEDDAFVFTGGDPRRGASRPTRAMSAKRLGRLELKLDTLKKALEEEDGDEEEGGGGGEGEAEAEADPEVGRGGGEAAGNRA